MMCFPVGVIPFGDVMSVVEIRRSPNDKRYFLVEFVKDRIRNAVDTLLVYETPIDKSQLKARFARELGDIEGVQYTLEKKFISFRVQDVDSEDGLKTVKLAFIQRSKLEYFMWMNDRTVWKHCFVHPSMFKVMRAKDEELGKWYNEYIRGLARFIDAATDRNHKIMLLCWVPKDHKKWGARSRIIAKQIYRELNQDIYKLDGSDIVREGVKKQNGLVKVLEWPAGVFKCHGEYFSIVVSDMSIWRMLVKYPTMELK
jgi:hypothetical protein